ncbi:MAG: helix-turn-helix transcriptional regulator [Ktedonobacteraceae bacterium]|nr:helix-turn-helix transcriptional regulator [Ktedonobacteraceae bacterium]
MDRFELQRLKMAWLAAKESGDTSAQTQILREHPGEREQLIDFIAAYSATGGSEPIDMDASMLPITQRAYQSALDRVFPLQTMAAFANLYELRKSRNLSKVEAAKGLRLGLDVWSKFEEGAVELVSLSQRQIERLATFFQVGIDQFGTLLDGSQAATTINRRQTAEAARNAKQGPQKQSFAEAIARSKMSKEDKQFWLE